MSLITLEAMADHLRGLVDDEEWITRTVRATFPEYKREAETTRRADQHARIASIRAITKEDQASSPHRKPDFFVLTEQQDRIASKSVSVGSKNLLSALWAHHGPILNNLRLRGNQVVDA